MFDERFYRAHNDLPRYARGPVARAHYAVLGRRRRLHPHPLFDPAWFTDEALAFGITPPQYRRELDDYAERADLWSIDPHPAAFFSHEPFASAAPTGNPLEAAKRLRALDAPTGYGHPLLDPQEWIEQARDPRIDEGASLDLMLRVVAEHVQAAAAAHRPISLGPQPDVLFINGETHCPACVQYRVWSPALALRRAGLRVAVINARDVGRLQGVLVRPRLAITFRALATPALVGFLTALRRHGAGLAFDCDDLLFGPPSHIGMQADGYGLPVVDAANRHAALMTRVVKLMNFATLPTETLANVAEDVGIPFDAIAVTPSFLSERQLAATGTSDVWGSPGSNSDLVAASGTWTHHADFAAVANPIGAALAHDPSVGLTLVGAITPDEFAGLRPVADRVQHDPQIIRDWAEYVGRYRRFRANVVPLDVNNGFCHAKSEVKYMEAGLAGLPTVASPTEAYRRALSQGGGMLARNDTEWYEAILRLGTNDALCDALGNAARRDVHARYGPGGAFERHYLASVDRMLVATEAARTSRRGSPIAEGRRRAKAVPALTADYSGHLVPTSVAGEYTFRLPDGSQSRAISFDGIWALGQEGALVLEDVQAAWEWLRLIRDGWVAEHEIGAQIIACGHELACWLRGRVDHQVLAGLPAVDARVFFQRESEQTAQDGASSVALIGPPARIRPAADVLAAATSWSEFAMATGQDAIYVGGQDPAALGLRTRQSWRTGGSPVDLATLLRRARIAVRLDHLNWTTCLSAAIATGVPIAVRGSRKGDLEAPDPSFGPPGWIPWSSIQVSCPPPVAAIDP